MMIPQLFTQLFNRLKKDALNDTPSKNRMAVYFVNVVLEEQMEVFNLISVKSIKGYYDKFVEGKENKSGVPSIELCNLIARYLGCENFSDFELKNKKIEVAQQVSFWGRITQGCSSINKSALSMGVGALLMSGVYYNESVTNCCCWDACRYVKESCQFHCCYYEEGVPDTIFNTEFLQEIVLDSNTVFLKKGTAVVWYSIPRKGNIEFIILGECTPLLKKD
ncbi:MAG: hypothetical protein COB98_07500 [Flavobacteriaceae bacterium]|nr:MAG: hypothetical protein COB98_07500 [Flavobacteriaceae bacterium]